MAKAKKKAAPRKKARAHKLTLKSALLMKNFDSIQQDVVKQYAKEISVLQKHLDHAKAKLTKAQNAKPAKSPAKLKKVQAALAILNAEHKLAKEAVEELRQKQRQFAALRKQIAEFNREWPKQNASSKKATSKKASKKSGHEEHHHAADKNNSAINSPSYLNKPQTHPAFSDSDNEMVDFEPNY